MNYIVNVRKKEVEEFLREVKNTKNEDFLFLNRFKEKEKDPYILLGKLGLNKNDLIEEIKKLEVNDFLRCQIDSKNKFLFMYNFIKIIDGIIVYIKLSILDTSYLKKVYIISYHEATINELKMKPYNN